MFTRPLITAPKSEEKIRAYNSLRLNKDHHTSSVKPETSFSFNHQRAKIARAMTPRDDRTPIYGLTEYQRSYTGDSQNREDNLTNSCPVKEETVRIEKMPQPIILEESIQEEIRAQNPAT